MTGKNKYVLSIYAKMIMADASRLQTDLRMCHNVLSKYDIYRLLEYGIPVVSDGISTKEKVYEYIYNTVIEYAPYANKSILRRLFKATDMLQRTLLSAILPH